MNEMTVKISKEEFLKLPEEERSYMTYSATTDLQERMMKCEGRPLWNQSKSFLGGILGGAIAIFAKTIVWR